MFVRSVTICLLLLFFTVTTVGAEENGEPFTTTVHSTYVISLSGTTTISHEFSLKNRTATSFVSQYALKSPLQRLEQVVATSGTSKVPVEVNHGDDGTTIVLKFDDQVVGENKTRSFTLTYTSSDTAVISGNILELYVPSISSEELYAQRSVTLKTPLRFGRATRVTPEPEAVSFTDTAAITNFPDLGKQGIVALFGDQQFFSVTLRYNLENSGNAPGIAQIALPPDTPYQKMQYQSLDPSPSKLSLDRDGNWIATYSLVANSALSVYLTAAVRISLWPSPDVPQTTVQPEHTQSQKFWETDDRAILDIAKNLTTPQAVYEYVVAALTYNLPDDTELSRKGAVAALANPTAAVCQEFTDLFVTLARSKNVPARRITGYAFSSNSELRPLSLQTDILHAWADFYDAEQQQWRQVDPTWGNTTGGADYFSQFDLNHIAFAINGISSSTPYAAGSYKSEAFESKDVSVALLNQFIPVPADLTLSLEKKRIFGIAIPGLYLAGITNKTGQAWYHLTAQFTAELAGVVVHPDVPMTDLTILPFQTLTFPVLVATDRVQLPQNTQLQAALLLGTEYNQTTEFAGIKSGLAVYQYLNETTIPLILVSGFTIGTLIAGSLLVFRRRW